jgi:hypothetical protein
VWVRRAGCRAVEARAQVPNWPQPNWCGPRPIDEAHERGEGVIIRTGCAIRNNDAGLFVTPQIQRDLQRRR